MRLHADRLDAPGFFWGARQLVRTVAPHRILPVLIGFRPGVLP